MGNWKLIRLTENNDFHGMRAVLALLPFFGRYIFTSGESTSSEGRVNGAGSRALLQGREVVKFEITYHKLAKGNGR